MGIKKERNYGIDLLRLIAMFMIVILHVAGHGGILRSFKGISIKSELIWTLEIACYSAVNIYALISGFVGIKSKYKYSNIINLCLQVIFFAITITSVEIAVTIYNGEKLSFSHLLFHFLPSLKNYWYFTAYFSLFFFIPVINYAINNTPKKILKILAVFIFVLFCCYSLISDSTMNLGGGYSFLWLAVLYGVGAYISKYDSFKKLSAVKCFLGYLICTLLTVASRIAIYFITQKVFGVAKGQNLLIKYTSPTMVLSALFLVLAFAKMKVNKSFAKVIGFLSPMSFGVYLIHCHPYIFSKIANAFISLSVKPVYILIPYILGISLAIFISCLFIDYIRLLLFKVCRIKEFSCWLEKIIGKFFKAILKIFKINFDEPIERNAEEQTLNNTCINDIENNTKNSENTSETDIKKE